MGYVYKERIYMNFNDLAPLKNRILVRKLQVQEKLDGGIYLGLGSPPKYQRCQTIAVGKDISSLIYKYCVLWATLYAGIPLDDMYMLVTHDDILGIE